MSGVPPARLSYTKAWLSVPDQVAKLQARGLQIPDLVEPSLGKPPEATLRCRKFGSR